MLKLNDTQALKGIALLMLLAHHLFWKNTELYRDIQVYGNYRLFQSIGVISKVCVSLFVFLSGYGLTKKYEQFDFRSKCDISMYYSQRYCKLFLNYWLIWLLFVPVSCLVGFTSQNDASVLHNLMKMISDLFCISGFLNLPFYNTTWWFMSCIIGLYALFPAVIMMIKKGYFLSLIAFSIAIYLIPYEYPTKTVWIYLPAFLCGIKIAKDNNLLLNKSATYVLYLVLGLLLIERLYVTYGILLDVIITIMIVLLYLNVKHTNWVSMVLMYFGKHSMSIFLFHTFIFHIWFRDFIYSTGNPIIIYGILLMICIMISELIIRVKRLVHFDKVLEKSIQICMYGK